MLITHTLQVLAVAYFVTSSAFKDDEDEQAFSVKSYKYNHPPLFEINEGLSDDSELEVRKIRQVKSREYEENEDNNSPKKINLDLEIPVTVVYETAIDSSRSNKIKKRKQTRRPNPIHERNEEVKITENDYFNDKKESSTERYLTTSPSPKTVVPKVFTKRPPEDNPIIKKIRQREPVVKIVEASNYVYAHNGNFHYSFEGADGTKVSSEGELKSFNGDKTGEAVTGSVFYKDNDGNDFSLSYTADENGYRPHGDHLPTPPPIPPAIARALKYLATKTTPQPVTETIKEIDY